MSPLGYNHLPTALALPVSASWLQHPLHEAILITSRASFTAGSFRSSSPPLRRQTEPAVQGRWAPRGFGGQRVRRYCSAVPAHPRAGGDRPGGVCGCWFAGCAQGGAGLQGASVVNSLLPSLCPTGSQEQLVPGRPPQGSSGAGSAQAGVTLGDAVPPESRGGVTGTVGLMMNVPADARGHLNTPRKIVDHVN